MILPAQINFERFVHKRDNRRKRGFVVILFFVLKIKFEMNWEYWTSPVLQRSQVALPNEPNENTKTEQAPQIRATKIIQCEQQSSNTWSYTLSLSLTVHYIDMMVHYVTVHYMANYLDLVSRSSNWRLWWFTSLTFTDSPLMRFTTDHNYFCFTEVFPLSLLPLLENYWKVAIFLKTLLKIQMCYADWADLAVLDRLSVLHHWDWSVLQG